MVERTVATYGRLDMAFNNAGIVGFTGDLAEESGESFDHLADECRASPTGGHAAPLCIAGLGSVEKALARGTGASPLG
jgi:NAD(P)-dependent dehydrogenase (short-subunit alcohol dehydrogenase family)